MYLINKFNRIVGLALFFVFIAILVLGSYSSNMSLLALFSNFKVPPISYYWYVVLVYFIWFVLIQLLRRYLTHARKMEVKKLGIEVIDENNLYYHLFENDNDLNQYDIKKLAIDNLLYFQKALTNSNYEMLFGFSTNRFYNRVFEVFPKEYNYKFDFQLIRDCRLIKIDEDSNYIALTFEVVTNEIYAETDDVNELTDGDLERRVNHVYDVTLIKRKSHKEPGNYEVGTCYNCSMQLSVNNTGACIQCNANMSSGAYGFVLDSVIFKKMVGSQHDLHIKSQVLTPTKKYKKRIKKEKADTVRAKKFLKTNFKVLTIAKEKGVFPEQINIFSTFEFNFYSDYANKIKLKEYKFVNKKQVIWNIILNDFYATETDNYYEYLVDGKQVNYLENSKNRIMLGDVASNVYFINKVVIKENKETKNMSFELCLELVSERM